ncbi:exo-beta-N-acetylmuramidase NamZ family protein [Actinomyces minihominis]|uniref:exo-beta-N-acetylmuramidase NamZ family protein n=1 Tax=Actinomyces minihominis TaxID=2002838 RepID=UPI000C06E720|nr:DUF1343 domain-containing protein [Actinomyces minihominis]
MRVRTGAERLLADPTLIPGRRWGLITNYTAVLPNLELSATLLHQETGRVAAILGPEHGLRGTAQAGFAEDGGVDPLTGLPVVDTYGKSGAALDEEIAKLGLDVLVADIQDVGARFYTYAWTVVDCMRSAARLGLPFYVLDRPNPLGGEVVDGPGLLPGFDSFIGRLNIPSRHGLTMGELAREAAAKDAAAGEAAVEPQVIRMEGWERTMLWDETGLPWVFPSPNLPTPDTALAYVGTCLFEGTNMSEGRGTTRPFELVGAPWLDEGFAAELNALDLPGVRFRSSWFVPTFQKHEGVPVGGVQLHVSDRTSFNPILTGVSMLKVAQQIAPKSFEWRLPDWEEGASTRPFIDLLWGSNSLRTGLASASGAAEVISEAPRAPEYLTEVLY